MLVKIILRSFGAIALGGIVVAAAVALLSLYGVSQDPVPQTAAQSLRFPENEQMLDTLPAQLAREAETLSTVEPAAGGAAAGERDRHSK